LNAIRLKEWLRVEFSGLEIPPPVERSVICHLDNPGPGRALSAVEDPTFLLDIEKQVLDQVFCFGCISQNADGHAPRQTRITFEESGQSFPVSDANLIQQRFIGDVWRH
jgi:hypothetical protein